MRIPAIRGYGYGDASHADGLDRRRRSSRSGMVALAPWGIAIVVAFMAGITDLRSRRIPNWITIPGLLLGLAANFVSRGWSGAGNGLLGAVAMLVLLLPFVLLRSLGAGDWKLMGAVGACVGLHHLLPVLLATLIANGILAAIVIVQKKRIGRALRNMWDMLKALATMQAPPRELTLDDPDATKIPFGVAAAFAVVFYCARQIWSVA